MLIDSLSITRIFSVFGLFIITAIAEILGCYFPYLILKRREVCVAMVTYSSEFGRVCLVADIASGSFWTDLCSLWRYLYFYCAYVASFCRSGRFNQMGYLGWRNRALRSRFNYFTAPRINPLILRVII